MKKILIADDQRELRELVEVTLRTGDYHVLHASNGTQAVKVTRSEKPELVIMDIMMPGKMDGLEATRVLKADPKTKNCKIIMLTAKGQSTDLEEGIKAGADGYFIKPFSPLDLIKKVEEVIG